MASLTNSDGQKLKLPAFTAARCVHTQIVNASCQACADVCHAKAWEIEDEPLGIDPELCDGCGICAAVCPEDAIEHKHSTLSIHWRDEKIALIACEKISTAPGDRSAGIMRCIHALGIRDLLELYENGHHRVLVSTASCEDCGRMPAPDAQLDHHLDTVNLLLNLRDKPLIERINISAEQWANIIRSADHTNSGKTLSRRHFMRQAASELSDYGLRRFEPEPSEEASPPPVARLLPASSAEQALPYVPQIEPKRCTACDTCIKLCPHDALLLDTSNAHSAYKIDAVNCSNCGICVDVCLDEAISIERNIVATQMRIPLETLNCPLCTLDFHSIDATPGALCPICQQKKHTSQLFQVLD